MIAFFPTSDLVWLSLIGTLWHLVALLRVANRQIKLPEGSLSWEEENTRGKHHAYRFQAHGFFFLGVLAQHLYMQLRA